jgi:hypothetical protein
MQRSAGCWSADILLIDGASGSGHEDYLARRVASFERLYSQHTPIERAASAYFRWPYEYE